MESGTQSSQRWLALYLPQFPLQSLHPAQPDRPLCLYEMQRGRQVISACNRAARQAGIKAGMTLAAAQPLADGLQAIARDPQREQAALRRLAQWAQQFTPVVSLQPPSGLLLEVGASLSLFGGIRALQQRIDEAIQRLGYRCRQGIAPTPGAAWLLAQAGIDKAIRKQSTLHEQIARLPVHLLSLDADTRQALRLLGIETIGACLQLPRAGLLRRFGAELPLQLDRILGLAPDPREPYQPPEHFHSQIMLPDAVQETEALLFLLRRLLQELSGFLLARNAGAQELQLGLIAPQRPIETLRLTLLAPTSNPDHLLSLWQEKLDRHPLAAPVEGIELRVTKPLPLSPDNLDLFAPRSNERPDVTRFLERLRNHLGPNTIRQLNMIGDHRPEKATTTTPWRHGQKPLQSLSHPHQRPPCLIDPPQALSLSNRGPQFHGHPLTLLAGPERIESGWWDSRGTRRDYYIARSQQQQTLWVFQEIGKDVNWYLHGYFG